jgi:enoyl-CoA hydratase
MWTWVQTMGLRKFQEMVFTGRPFTADEMYDCNFLNKVVPRDELEEETAKYALACARNRPTDTVFMQKVFFEVYKQHQGEYMGSLLSGFFESMGSGVAADTDDLMIDDAIDTGLSNAVKDNDEKFPPEFRLTKSGRKKAKKAKKA